MCFSRNNLSEIKYGAYITNLDEYESIGTYLIALYANAENVTYFESFGVKRIPNENRRFIGNKNISTNIYRIQAYNYIMSGYFCTEFVDFTLKGNSLLNIQIYFPLMNVKRTTK